MVRPSGCKSLEQETVSTASLFYSKEANLFQQNEMSDESILFFRPGTASAVDQREFGAGRDVGSVAVFSRRVGGQV